MSEKILEFRNIMKEFPGVKALDDVSMDFGQGEVVALLGENGAGKSTLMKVLSGAYTRDSGDVILDGRELPKQYSSGHYLSGAEPDGGNDRNGKCVHNP